MLSASGIPLALSLPLRSEREPEYGAIYSPQRLSLLCLSEGSGLSSLFSSLFVQSRPHIQRLWKCFLTDLGLPDLSFQAGISAFFLSQAPHS